MKRVASIILSGGEGTRLYPLTLSRCKPAVNFGGKYRLIDVPISNSIHANCAKIFILSQFLSSSLHKHITQTYLYGNHFSNQIEILTAEQKPASKDWYMGTADAVRQNLDYIRECSVDYFLILSGDQLYNFEFQEMLNFALEEDADLVVASLPVTEQAVTRMGVLTIDAHKNIINFHEKPQDKKLIEKLRLSSEVMKGIEHESMGKFTHLGSMGIYLFKRKTLIELLQNDSREDFGKHLIPSQIKKGKVKTYIHKGYWEDIGTIDNFHKANLALTQRFPSFEIHPEVRALFSSLYNLPPARFFDSQIDHSLICEGAVVNEAEISHCLLGPRTYIEDGVILRNSYLMGNDYYQAQHQEDMKLPQKPRIGAKSIIQNAILDKNVHIGQNVKLINQQKLDFYNGDNIYIRDGIIVVPRGAFIPDGFTL